MKGVKFGTLQLLILIFTLTGCCRNKDDIWDDTKTAGRHMSRGVRSLGGKHGDSRQIRRKEDFYPTRDEYCIEDWQEPPFEPLSDQMRPPEITVQDGRQIRFIPQSQLDPGNPKGSVPGIHSFTDPKLIPSLAGIFQNIHFAYNSSLVKGQENINIIRAVANFLKTHPETYLFVEGHCDERGAEAYNLALGVRRSNIVRNLLVQEGANPQNIFTISYGKERPLEVGNSEISWGKNRRAEFKIYQR
jgi:peptidoglycan-associated lipoprotein